MDDREAEDAAGPQDPGGLRDCAPNVIDVKQGHERHHQGSAAVSQRQTGGVGLRDRERRRPGGGRPRQRG